MYLISYPFRHGYGPYGAMVKEKNLVNVTDEEDPGSHFFLTRYFGLNKGFSFCARTSQADVLHLYYYLNQH